jgi:hypothetical protein
MVGVPRRHFALRVKIAFSIFVTAYISFIETEPENCQSEENSLKGASIPVEGIKYTYLPTGKWKNDPHKKFYAPICCGWDKDAYLEHPNECGGQPLAKINGSYQGRNEFLAHSGGNGCTCYDFHDEYTWIDDDLPLFNASQTCLQLNCRSVLMIGDSTMEQTASTLMNALFIAGCQTQITYTPGDTLVGETMGVLNWGMKWTESVSLYNPDIVIISAGPHIFHRSNFESVINSVVLGSKEVKRINPNIQVVWKTQQPGGCTPGISTVIHTGNDYNYGEFYERDLYAMSVLPHHGIHIIDMRMLYFRSDAHVSSKHGGGDCLHMCVPGPLDVIAPLFLQLLNGLS